MLKLSRLETRTQEIVLIVTAMSSLSLLFGSLFYLYLSPQVINSITGDTGTRALSFLFHNLGYATFLIPFAVWVLGDFLITRANTLPEIAKFWRQIGWHSLLLAFVTVVSASFLTIIQAHFAMSVDKGICHGAGGALGQHLGGELYRQFGLFGASLILLSASLIAGIISGFIELVSVILYIAELAKFAWRETLHWSRKGYQYAVARMRLHEGALQDGLLEFESATGHYVSPHEAPRFVHHFVEKELAPAEPREKLIELTPEGVAKKAPAGAAPDFHTLTSGREHTPEPKRTRAKRAGHKAAKDAKEEHWEAPAAAETAAAESSTAAGAEALEGESAGAPEQIAVTPYRKRYSAPDLALLKNPVKLHPPTKTEIEKQSRELESRLQSFKLTGKIVDVHTGCRLTMYEFMPDAGVKLSKIASLSNDLALLLGADSIRILTPIPGKTTVGIEVPNEKPTPLNFSELVKACEKAEKEKALPIALGKNVYNDVVIGDIAAMPHLLISGTTGSGKSVFMNTLINSLIYTKSPKELRFLMVDPKMIELSPYNGIPHLLKPVVTDVVEAKNLLVWAENEMDKRYKMFGETGSRNIVSFNEMIGKGSQASAERKAGKKFDWEWAEMPYIVIVIDELADLMITQGKEVEIPITRIAQKARAAGIHLVIATQRPSAEIVTGLIKTNFPTRIAFKVSSAIDSRTILDTAGAEKLLGNGDMLYMPNGKAIERVQASFISEEEVKKIVRSISEE